MEWTNIEDQIPSIEVLCVSAKRDYMVGYVSVREDGVIICESNDETLIHVTYWMLLPEYPKE